ncbi:MAG: hypothetical protein QM758_13385 [Armatimonas sp.]
MTLHFIQALVALIGMLTHILMGSFVYGSRCVAFLAIDVVPGAKLSHRIHGVWIFRGLGIALGLVGVR